MKVLDDENRKIEGIMLLLTPAEAREMADSLADLAEHPEKKHHHVMSEDATSEVTVAVYTKATLGSFTPEIRRILEEAV